MTPAVVMLYNTTAKSMKLIVLDWDQTLWNSWDIHVMAAQHAEHVVEIPEPSPELIASNFSVPFARHLELLFPKHTAEATRHYLSYYHSRVNVLASLFDGVPEMLASLRRSGCFVALLSDKRHVYGTAELQSAGIGDLFDYVLFLDDGRAYKPDPQGLRQVVDALSVEKGDSLYVGDSHVDVACARSAGVASAAALWGSVGVDAVLGPGAGPGAP